jgi:hypothetical protein
MKTRSGVSTSQETKGFALITGASSGIGDREDDGAGASRSRTSLKQEEGELESGTESRGGARQVDRGALLGASTAAAIAIGVLETPLIR